MMKASSGRSIESCKLDSNERSKQIVKVPSTPKSSGFNLIKAMSSKRVAKLPSSEKHKNKTQISHRLTAAIINHPVKSGRSQDIVPMSKDFDRLRKNLKDLIEVARRYHKTMIELGKIRTQLYHKTATLSVDAHLNDLVGWQGNDNGCSLQALEEKISQGNGRHAKTYQDLVIDYALEWEAVTSKMVDEGIQHTHKLHKIVQHYEEKVDKLRKIIKDREENGKTPTPAQLEKMGRNDAKLAKAWEDYDLAGTRTAHLLEEITKMGWRDLHPLIQGMITFEQERGRDEQSLLEYVGTIQDRLIEVVTNCEDAVPTTSSTYASNTVQEDEAEVHADTTELTEIHLDSSEEEKLPAVEEEVSSYDAVVSESEQLEPDKGSRADM